ncbi:hypothetical protein BGZ82_003373 [Podila clonocystis]|nr:hypothetical protein BGZ82_003373 [Podila clonocystis]
MSPNQAKRPAWDELDASLSRQNLESKHQQKRAKLYTGCDPFNAEAANAINGMFDRVIAIASSHIPHLAKAKKPRLTPLDSNDPHKPQGRDTIAAPATPWHPMTHTEKEARALEIGPGFRKSMWSTLPAKTSIEDKPAPPERKSHNISPVASISTKRQLTPESDSSVVELLSSDDDDGEDQDHEQDEEAEYSEENFDPDAEEESVQYDDEVDEYDENNPIQFEDTDELSETEDASGPVVKDRPEHVALSLVPDNSKRHFYQQEGYSDRGSSPLEGSTGDYDEGLDDKDLKDEDVVDDEESDRNPADDEAEEYSEGDYDEEEEELQAAEAPQGDLPAATNSDPYILLDSDDDAPGSQEEELDASGEEYDEHSEGYGRDEEYDEQIEEYIGQDEGDDGLSEHDGQVDDYDNQHDIEPQDMKYDTGDVQFSSLDDQDIQAPVDFGLSDANVETVELEEQDVISLEEVSHAESTNQVYFEPTAALSHNLVAPGDMDLSGEQMPSDIPDILFPVARDDPVVGEFIYSQDTFTQPNQYLAEVHPVQNQTSLSETLVTHDMDDVHLLANFLEVHQDAESRIETPISSHSQDVDAVVALKDSIHYGEPVQIEETVQPEDTVQLVETVQLKEAFQHEASSQYEETVDYDETGEGHTQHEDSIQLDETGGREEFSQGEVNHYNVLRLTDDDVIPMETKDDDTTSQQVATSNISEVLPEVVPVTISESSEEPLESPRNSRLLRSGTMVITAREGRAFIERQERQEGTSVEGRTRKAHSAPSMVTRRAAASEDHQQPKESQEDDLEVSSSPSPRFLPDADFGRSTPPNTSVRRGGGGEVDLLVKEAREFCGRVSPASRTGSSPGSLGGHYSAPIIAPPPFGHVSPSHALNADSTQGYIADSSEKSRTNGEWSRDAHADTSSPTSTTTSATTPTKRGVVDLAEENVIQSTVVGSHALRKFIHPPPSMGASSHGTNTHGSGQAQSRSSSLEPVISPRTLHSNSMFSFGQNPLGLILGTPPAPPAFGSVSVSAPVSVGYGFGSTIAPGGAVAREQIMARNSPHKARSQPLAPTKIGGEEPLYPLIEDHSLEQKSESQEQNDEAAQADREQEEPDEEGGASDEEAEAPEAGSSSPSPLFVLKTKKKKSPAQVKARNKARRMAAKNQKSAKAQTPPV